MTLQRTYQSELKDWVARFRSNSGYPKKAVTVVLREKKLIAQYETKEGIPNIDKMRKTATEVVIAGGVGAAVAGGAAMIIGRTLLGGALGRIGIAGAFGAVGLGVLGPAVLVGGTAASVGYALYKVGKNREQNKQAQEFGEELQTHLKEFQPKALPPSDLIIVTSTDRRITVIYDPEMGKEDRN